MLLSAFKTPADVYNYPPKGIPSSFKFTNFAEVFKKYPLSGFYANSTSSRRPDRPSDMDFRHGTFAFAKLDFP